MARFLQSGRSGFYFSVEREGSVKTGDAFELLSQESRAITIAEMNHLFADDRYNRGLLDKAIATPGVAGRLAGLSEETPERVG